MVGRGVDRKMKWRGWREFDLGGRFYFTCGKSFLPDDLMIP